jgi:hypothetical protein
MLIFPNNNLAVYCIYIYIFNSDDRTFPVGDVDASVEVVP